MAIIYIYIGALEIYLGFYILHIEVIERYWLIQSSGMYSIALKATSDVNKNETEMNCTYK